MVLAAFAGLGDHLAAVETHMVEALATPVPRVADLIARLGRFHGKMLRPALLLLVAETLGGADGRHRKLGASLELIHTATLIHDDLIDGSDMRRGQPSAHIAFGNPTAVLLGDFFYTRAFSLVAGLGDPWLVQRLTAATNVVCEGELHQQLAERDADLDEAEYERIVYGKTAALTELAGEIGALAGDAGQRAAAAAFGRACGMAFQVVDDCLDLIGDPERVGKSLATDLERGRVTLPTIRVLAAAPAGERKALADRLLRIGADPAEGRRLVVERGGVGMAMSRAREHLSLARAAADKLPAGAGRQRLESLATFIVERDF